MAVINLTPNIRWSARIFLLILMWIGASYSSQSQTPWAAAPALPGTTNLAPNPSSPARFAVPQSIPFSSAPSAAANIPSVPANPKPGIAPSQRVPQAAAVNSQLVSFETIPATASDQLESGELIAVVGSAHILAGDVAVFVEPIIADNRDKISSPEQERQLREDLTRKVLKQYIPLKAMQLEFYRDIVGTAPPKEMQAMKKQVETKVSKAFYEQQLPSLLKRYEAQDIPDLELKLSERSLSLMALKKQFVEQVLSAELENKYVPKEFEVDRDELMKYYKLHQSEWSVPARAKWRQLTIRFDEHSRAEARQLIDTMLQEMVYGGKRFDVIAMQSSEGFTAQQGGIYDWTSRGSLKSKVLDNAIFTYPLRELSPVLEDELGFHIVEVLEREAEHTKDFAFAQAEIRKLLSEEKREEAKEKLRDKVLARTPIWSRWPEDVADIPGVRALADALGPAIR
ncbi:MAG: peptidylprolyl isomerase [Planctomycetales bacterium]|nr:peptidylprolyl isomerase [Planctomycetales bacterium]